MPQGSFKRSFDGATFSDSTNDAYVSAFRLDKYEVTVGRFRKFVEAWLAGWRPAQGAGKHTHLNGGLGLGNVGAGGGNEFGWQGANRDKELPTTAGDRDTVLIAGSGETWSKKAGNGETRPIDYVTWYEA